MRAEPPPEVIALNAPKASPPPKTWIFERSGAGGPGGGNSINAAPPVTIDKFAADGVTLNPVVTAHSDGQYEVTIYYTVDPTATSQNFAGVAIFVENPDISSAPVMTLDGTSPLDGTRAPTGKWTPAFQNNNYSTWTGTTETHNPADVLISLKPRMTRTVRIYLASFGPNANPTLVRANQTGATPSVVVDLSGTAHYIRGEEYAWLVTNCQVAVEEDFNRPDPQYRLEFSYTPPDPNTPTPTGMNPFGGVEIVFAYPDAGNTDPIATITDTGVFVPYTAANGYLSPVYSPGSGGTFRVYFCSGDNSQPAHVNTLIPGVTPYVTVTITYPPTGPGTSPQVPDVIKFALANPRLLWQPDGSYLAFADLTWSLPANVNNYSGLMFYKIMRNGAQLFPPYLFPQQAGAVDTSLTLEVNPPQQNETWTILAISVDASGRLNNDPANPHAGSPEVTWAIGPPGPGSAGEENSLLADASAVTIVTDQQVSSDGVQMMRFEISGLNPNPTNSSRFGGTSIRMQDNRGTSTWDAKGATSYITPWQPAVSEQDLTFWFLTYDSQNNQNTVAPGLTPSKVIHFIPSPGNIIATRLPTNWFSTAEFSWPNANAGGLFSINQIAAGKVFVGTILRVGGAPPGSGFDPSFTGNGQVAVYSSGTDPGDQNGTPTMRAWMGQQTTTFPGNPPNYGTVYGGWFSALYIGGTSPVTAPVYVNNGGVVIVGGWDVQGTAYPYISVRDKYGVEMGRIGAALNMGPDPSNAVGTGAPPIQGAWFNQFAIGGKNLADWRLLAAGDNTIKVRNINRFEIDYNANLSGYNEPYQLLLGTDVAYATTIGGWSFPGITLMRRLTDVNQTVTTHGIVLINRGIICQEANAVGGYTMRAALYTFNGDPNGGDSPEPFWGELAMRSPTSGNINVLINSGYVNTGVLTGNASLSIADSQGNARFQVRADGIVLLGMNEVYWSNYNASSKIIDNTGAWVGAIKVSSFSATKYSITNLTPSAEVISATGQFDGVGGVNTSGVVQSSTYLMGASFRLNNNPGVDVIDQFGNWKGQPITGAQTPWKSPIDAANYSLTGIPKIQSNQSSFVLTDSASGGTPVLAINGNGIIVSGAFGGFPNLNLQRNNITMLNSSGAAVFVVDLNGYLTCATADGSGNWTGSLQTGTGLVVATKFGIYGVGFGPGTPASPMTFTTTDGHTVTVIGGIITKIQ